MKSKKLLVSIEFFETLNTPIFIKNRNGVYVYCNSAFSNFLGLSKNSIIQNTTRDVSPQKLANIYEDADKKLFLSQRSQEYVGLVKTKDNIEKQVLFKKSLFYDEHNEIDGFIGAIDNYEELINGAHSGFAKLSKREKDVLNLLAQGRSVKTIANLLLISPHTITDYTKSIYLKLDAHSKGEAIFKAITLLSSPTSDTNSM